MLKHKEFQMPCAGTGPVEDGGTSNITGLGSVTNSVDEDSMTITNQTNPDHLLHDGKVERQVIVRNGEVGIQTTGTGNGALPMLNECFASSVWDRVDSRLRKKFNRGNDN